MSLTLFCDIIDDKSNKLAWRFSVGNIRKVSKSAETRAVSECDATTIFIKRYLGSSVWHGDPSNRPNEVIIIQYGEDSHYVSSYYRLHTGTDRTTGVKVFNFTVHTSLITYSNSLKSRNYQNTWYWLECWWSDKRKEKREREYSLSCLLFRNLKRKRRRMKRTLGWKFCLAFLSAATTRASLTRYFNIWLGWTSRLSNWRTQCWMSL